GIWQVGCGTSYGGAPTALEVRNSSFRAIRAKPDPFGMSQGTAIVTWDCARSLRVADSMFADSDRGIEILRHGAGRDPHDPDPPAVIEHNEFAALRSYAIRLASAAQVDLLDNYVWGAPAGIVI